MMKITNCKRQAVKKPKIRYRKTNRPCWECNDSLNETDKIRYDDRPTYPYCILKVHGFNRILHPECYDFCYHFWSQEEGALDK